MPAELTIRISVRWKDMGLTHLPAFEKAKARGDRSFP